MQNLRKKQRIQIIVLSFVALSIATVLVGFAMRDGINYFRSPTQVNEDPPKTGEVFRLGGLVENGSISEDLNGSILFRVTDTSSSIDVKFNGILPDLFAENQGMIALGTLQDGTFIASEVLAKHDEKYMPKEVVDALKEQGVYQEIIK